MAERFNAPVLKTGDPKGSVGSNPTPSAKRGIFVLVLRRRPRPRPRKRVSLPNLMNYQTVNSSRYKASQTCHIDDEDDDENGYDLLARALAYRPWQ